MRRSCVPSLLGSLFLLLFASSAFAQAFLTPCPDTSRAVVAGDFNGDGKLDLALVRQGSSKVFLHSGDGSGGLGTPTQISSGLLQPHSVVAGDFVPGGGLDLAVAGFFRHRPFRLPEVGLSILSGDGAGNFEVVQRFLGPFTLGVPVVAAGDFNGDGKQDLAVADGTSNVFIFLQTGQGFVPSSVSSIAFQLTDLALGDIDGDTRLDMAIGITFGVPGEVAVRFGNGVGGLGGGPKFDSGGIGPRSLVTGDFNEDGNIDLAVLHFGSNDISLFLGDGTGNFALSAGSPFELPKGDHGASLVARDFNGDGKLDLAAATTGNHVDDLRIFILLGDGTGGFPTSLELNPELEPLSIAAGDFNGDGLPDLAVSFFCGTGVTILINPLPPPGKPLVYVTIKKEDKVSVIDPETDTVVETILVDRKPDGIAILPNGTKVYVVNERKPEKGSAVTVITTAVPPAFHTILTTIPVGKKARGIAATPVPVNPGDGNGARFFVFVAEENEKSVGVIDSESNTLISRVLLDPKGLPAGDGDDDDDDEESHPPGKKPFDIAFSPDGAFAYVLAKAPSALVVLDTAKAVTDPTNAVLNRIRIRHGPSVVAADPLGQFVYVGRERHGGGEILILNASGAPALTTFGTIGVGRKPKGIAIRADGSRLYVSNHRSDDVTVISRSGATHTVLNPSLPVGKKPLGIAILPDSTKVYVANEQSDTVSVIETVGNSVAATVPVGKDPRRIAAGRVPAE